MSTYKKSGVDVEKAEGLVTDLRKRFSGLGGYAGMFDLGDKKLAATCDGVGTKIRLAVEFGMHEVVGEDLVAMSVNDLIAGGAKPLFFLDYFSCGKLDKEIFNRVMAGIEAGLKKCDCRLIGGETAEMPDMYREGDYDLAGFACGLVLKEFDKDKIKKGDLIAGISSNGIHSNGFSLVRKVFDKPDLAKYIDIIMTPTRIYFEFSGSGKTEEITVSKIKNMAHVTGGGIKRALKRLLPDGLNADFLPYDTPEIFRLIASMGVDKEEMENVFNMGYGMMFAIDEHDKDIVLNRLDARIIGHVV